MRIVSGRGSDDSCVEHLAGSAQFSGLEPSVRRIVEDVRAAESVRCVNMRERWDGLGANERRRVPQPEMEAAWTRLSPGMRSPFAGCAEYSAILRMAKPDPGITSHGISLGQLVRPIDSVGCYVPGGRYPLVSTLLMTVIPAQVAGVNKSAWYRHEPSPQVLAAAAMLALRRFTELAARRPSRRWPMERRAFRE